MKNEHLRQQLENLWYRLEAEKYNYRSVITPEWRKAIQSSLIVYELRLIDAEKFEEYLDKDLEEDIEIVMLQALHEVDTHESRTEGW